MLHELIFRIDTQDSTEAEKLRGETEDRLKNSVPVLSTVCNALEQTYKITLVNTDTKKVEERWVKADGKEAAEAQFDDDEKRVVVTSVLS